MRVNIIKKDNWRIPRQFVTSWLKAVSGELGKVTKHKIAKREIIVVFVDRKEIHGLNRQFRGKNKATDILSFAPMEPNQLGELALCGDIVAGQAKDHQLTLKQELGYLLIHGVLHLLGYDHEKGGPEAKKMFALQDQLFAKMNKRFFKGQ